MSIFDILVFLTIIASLHLYKARNPNFLFFCLGSVLFLPPKDLDPKQKPKPKPKGQQQKFEVTVAKIQYQHVKQYPLCSDYDRISIVLVAIFIFLIIKIAVHTVVGMTSFSSLMESGSNFLFFVCLLAFVYAVNIGLKIFWVSSYDIKICMLISLAVNGVFFLLYTSMQSLGIYDRRIIVETADFSRHIEVLMGKQITFITPNSVLLTVFCLNFILTLVVIPTVIKFGNWYAKTVKEIYFQDDENKQRQSNVNNKEQAQQNLKAESKKVIKYLNGYLFASLALIVLSHRSVQNYIDGRIVDGMRAGLLLLCAGLNCITLKEAIEFNGSYSYQYITQFYSSTDLNEKLQLKIKIASFIRLIWYHVFQFMFRIILPMFIFSMLMDWKYLFPVPGSYSLSQVPNDPISTNLTNSQFAINNNHPTNFEVQCGVFTDPLSAIESLYRCSVDSIRQSKVQTIFTNGRVLIDSDHTGLAKIQKRINEYGISWQPFVVEYLEMLFWYSSVTLYGLTIFYVLFLRKTVYNI